MKKDKIVNGIGYIITLLIGLLVASYYPLPGINNLEIHEECIEPIECPVGFATLEEMRFLVEELRICKELR